MPQYVVALVEHRHLGKGEATSANPALAMEIRDLGHKYQGKIIKYQDRSIDQCGHIIARSLGGKMERRNLFPIGRNTNLSQYINAERHIREFILENEQKKGRALIQVKLEYEDGRFPCRPTSFKYSYVLFRDDKDGKQKEADPGSLNNVFLEITVVDAMGEEVSIQVDEKNVVKSRTKMHCNRPSKSTWNKVAEEGAFWTSLAIMVLQIAVPEMSGQQPKNTASNPTSGNIAKHVPNVGCPEILKSSCVLDISEKFNIRQIQLVAAWNIDKVFIFYW